MRHEWNKTESKALNMTMRGYVAEVVAMLAPDAGLAEIHAAVMAVGRSCGCQMDIRNIAESKVRAQLGK